MRALLAIIAGAMLVLASPPLARAGQASPYLFLQQRDQALFHAGWRLVTGNAPFCTRTVPATGLLLHDAATYPDPPAARAALGLAGDVAVQAVAAGSPAARSNVPVGATLKRLEARDLAAAFPPSQPPWQRLLEIEAALEQALARAGEAKLTWEEAGGSLASAAVRSVPACHSRFEVTGIGERAAADGERVLVGDRFPGFDWPEEEFAAAVAHELAHNLLGHRAWLDRHGRSRSNVRRTEEEADRLAPWLLANAGYDPAAAVRMMRRWGPDHGGGLLRKRTHAGWDERAEMIAGELPLIDRARASEGRADWSRYFRRETGG
ncbi:hypothetical protein U4960_01855 [Altererythrobacter sp. H2]|uniref:hypothetical protein n=1 Tax=Altererythrobacter sp. H2 TaxID=3108391 RepID=UPI002B4BE4C7|nr:hypothetical protein [Altererythrobacter sp. H2]WRK96099.1 hypothetical protein U4960_01855 [Altererythrobacter sp. H2]